MAKGIPKNGINTGRFKKGEISPRKGAVVSIETREKMRMAKLGKKVIFSDQHRRNLSIALKGNSNTKGKKRIFTEKWKRNMSLAKIGKPSKAKGKTWKINPIYIPSMRARMLGDKNPAWKPDRSQLAKKQIRNDGAYFEWRRQVWARDNFKCLMKDSDCNGSIEAHHILRWIEYPELRYDVKNGITLCHKHHPRKKVDEVKMIPTYKELIF